MHPLVPLIRREIHSWLYSSVFYTYIILFSFFSLAAMFLLSGFLERNEAELTDSFFGWHPWIFAMLAPVIGMRSWSEESQCGIFEVLGTQPIRISHVVIAKTLSAFIVIILSLVFTFPAVITVLILGSPDTGIIVSGYIGSILCGCSFVAISQAICAYMRVSIGTFICSIAVCLILVICGIDDVANIILKTFPNFVWVTEMLSGLSILTKYLPFSQGRLEPAALFGFFIIIIISMGITLRALLVQRSCNKKNSFIKKSRRYGVPIYILLISYILLSTGFNFIPGYIDLTEDKKFTLPREVSKKIEKLRRPVTIRLFSTKNHPKFGFNFARYEKRIRETLIQLKKKSQGKIDFEILDPNQDQEAARIAAIDDVQSYSDENSKPFIFSVVVESLDKRRVFNSISPQREKYFLSDLIQAIIDLDNPHEKNISILSPLTSRSDAAGFSKWSGLTGLDPSYKLREFDINDPFNASNIVILFHNNELDSSTNKYLEQYLLFGGNIIVLTDPYSYMVSSFAGAGSESIQSSSIPDFVKKRGIELVKDQTIYDDLLKTKRASDSGSASDFSFLSVGASQLHSGHPITAGFDLIQLLYAGALKLKPTAGLKTTVLASSSKQAQTLDIDYALQPQSIIVEQAMGEAFNIEAGYPLIVLQESEDTQDSGRLVVVSDIDWLYNIIAGIKKEDGRLNSQNANIGLMRNIIDYLYGDPSLKDLRVMSLSQRPLHKWGEMRQAISKLYLRPIAKISGKIIKLEKELGRIIQARKPNSDQINRNSKVEKKIEKYRREIRLLNIELITLRSEREQDIRKQLTIIKWINIITVPLIIFFIAMTILAIRYKDTRSGDHE
ncbi:Gldg family protein [Agarilytica rhodophyticola]|uniref:Gldg family protein n=1 Tax=Agarilytica rhodophyticola TaxID=1737490 RepID=UPI000B347EA2|nr:Gldg family protein [Agarilytica rhodophyticola]